MGLRRAAVNRTKGGRLRYVSSSSDRKSLADLFRSLQLSPKVLVLRHGQNLHPVRRSVKGFTLLRSIDVFFQFVTPGLRPRESVLRTERGPSALEVDAES